MFSNVAIMHDIHLLADITKLNSTAKCEQRTHEDQCKPFMVEMSDGSMVEVVRDSSGIMVVTLEYIDKVLSKMTAQDNRVCPEYTKSLILSTYNTASGKNQMDVIIVVKNVDGTVTVWSSNEHIQNAVEIDLDTGMPALYVNSFSKEKENVIMDPSGTFKVPQVPKKKVKGTVVSGPTKIAKKYFPISKDVKGTANPKNDELESKSEEEVRNPTTISALHPATTNKTNPPEGDMQMKRNIKRQNEMNAAISRPKVEHDKSLTPAINKKTGIQKNLYTSPQIQQQMVHPHKSSQENTTSLVGELTSTPVAKCYGIESFHGPLSSTNHSIESKMPKLTRRKSSFPRKLLEYYPSSDAAKLKGHHHIPLRGKRKSATPMKIIHMEAEHETKVQPSDRVLSQMPKILDPLHSKRCRKYSSSTMQNLNGGRGYLYTKPTLPKRKKSSSRKPNYIRLRRSIMRKFGKSNRTYKKVSSKCRIPSNNHNNGIFTQQITPSLPLPFEHDGDQGEIFQMIGPKNPLIPYHSGIQLNADRDMNDSSDEEIYSRGKKTDPDVSTESNANTPVTSMMHADGQRQEDVATTISKATDSSEVCELHIIISLCIDGSAMVPLYE